MKYNILIALAFFFAFCIACSEKDELTQSVFTAVGDKVRIDGVLTESDLIAKSALSISNGETSFYVGYQQVSGNNQNPVAYRYDNGQLTWRIDDYEVTGDDGSAYGILWDGNETLYIVFSATGTQGKIEDDYRRFCINGWLTSYGSGGGSKVSIIAKINVLTGIAEKGTFLYAKKSNGETNSLTIKSLKLDSDGNLVVTCDSWYSPLQIDKTPFTCTGDSPFEYTITFEPNLSKALSAKTEQCN